MDLTTTRTWLEPAHTLTHKHRHLLISDAMRCDALRKYLRAETEPTPLPNVVCGASFLPRAGTTLSYQHSTRGILPLY